MDTLRNVQKYHLVKIKEFSVLICFARVLPIISNCILQIFLNCLFDILHLECFFFFL